MRDWLTIIIVVLIFVILVDGVRRMRLARRDKIRMSRNIYKPKPSREETPVVEAFTSELPNGGARVVAHRNSAEAPTKPAKNIRREQSRPEQTSLNLSDTVPMLMESVVDDVLMKDERTGPTPASATRNTAASAGANRRRETAEHGERIEPTLFDKPATASADDYEDDSEHPAYAHDQQSQSPYDQDDAYEEDELVDDEELDEAYEPEQEEYEDDFEDSDEDYEDSDYDDGDEGYEDELVSEAAPANSSERASSEPEEVLIINIMSVPGAEFFRGDELLDVLLRCGMRFGDMNIFHRYSDSKGDGALLFSMANMVKPGTFDLDTMDQFETPGISLFMTLPLKADSLQSFELMVDTARTIAEALDGELKDEQRSVMTRQTIEHCRERIRDFERRRLFSRQR